MEIGAFKYWTAISLIAETNVKRMFINVTEKSASSRTFRDFGYIFELIPMPFIITMLVLVCEHRRIRTLRNVRRKSVKMKLRR